jgi:hypothetical protein
MADAVELAAVVGHIHAGRTEPEFGVVAATVN